jgi:hypothetical protein
VRRLPFLVLVAVLLSACRQGENTATPTSSSSPSGSPSASPSISPSPSASPSPEPRPIPPAWAQPIDEDLEPEDLADGALVPPGARITDRVTLAAAGGLPDQVAVAYVVGDDPFAAEHGFAMWQRFPEAPAWSVVLAFVDSPHEGVLGIRVQAGDLTGDGHDDVLTFEETGGSGACGTWRVMAAAADGTDRLMKRRTCDAELVIAGGALELREAVYEPGDAHCCPSAFRYTTLEWDGREFVETDVVVEPTG